MISTPSTLNPYAYALNNPVLFTDPSGEIVPFLAIAGIGFAAGAIIDAYQQTDGFKNFCKFDVLEILAWGTGGAVTATAATLFVISGVGFVGMGMQRIALSLSGYAATSSIATSIWMAGTSTVGASSVATAWLFNSQTSTNQITDPY